MKFGSKSFTANLPQPLQLETLGTTRKLRLGRPNVTECVENLRKTMWRKSAGFVLQITPG
jgi:hypothetical protein